MDFLSQAAQRVVEVQYSSIVAQALSPAILLTAISAFLTLLMNRLWRVLDRLRPLADAHDTLDEEAIESVALLHLRARLIYRAIYACVGAAISVTAVVLLTFANRLFGAIQDWGVAFLFILAISLFALGFVYMLREVRLAIGEFEQQSSRILSRHKA